MRLKSCNATLEQAKHLSQDRLTWSRQVNMHRFTSARELKKVEKYQPQVKEHQPHFQKCYWAIMEGHTTTLNIWLSSVLIAHLQKNTFSPQTNSITGILHQKAFLYAQENWERLVQKCNSWPELVDCPLLFFLDTMGQLLKWTTWCHRVGQIQSRCKVWHRHLPLMSLPFTSQMAEF